MKIWEEHCGWRSVIAFVYIVTLKLALLIFKTLNCSILSSPSVHLKQMRIAHTNNSTRALILATNLFLGLCGREKTAALDKAKSFFFFRKDQFPGSLFSGLTTSAHSGCPISLSFRLHVNPAAILEQTVYQESYPGLRCPVDLQRKQQLALNRETSYCPSPSAPGPVLG